MVDTAFERTKEGYLESIQWEANLRASLQNHLLPEFNNRGVYRPRTWSPARVAVEITVFKEDLRLARYGMARHRDFVPTKSGLSHFSTSPKR